MLADVLTFLEGFADLFGLVLVLGVGFAAVRLVVELVKGAWGQGSEDE